MALIVLLDQHDSRTQPDLIGEWQAGLNRVLGDQLALPFTRTAGDEMQAVLGRPEALGEVARRALASGSWWMGVGIGEIEEPRPKDLREGRGSAFWSARDAIRKAKGQRRARPVAVIGAPECGDTPDWLDESLGALAFIISRRTEAQRRAADAYDESGASVQRVAERLNLSVQGARQRIVAAGCEEADDLIRLTGRIAARVTEPWD